MPERICRKLNSNELQPGGETGVGVQKEGRASIWGQKKKKKTLEVQNNKNAIKDKQIGTKIKFVKCMEEKNK